MSLEAKLKFSHKSCANCWHGRDGGCLLISLDCGTAVFNKASDPPRWTAFEKGFEEELRLRKLGIIA